MDLVDTASSDLPESRVQNSRRRGLPLLLDWLEEQPGQTWQDRWLASGADDARGQWGDLPAGWLRDRGLLSKTRLELMTSSLLVLVGADIIRPSLEWLLTGGRKRKLARNMIRARDQEGFARLARACDDDPGITPHARKHVLFRVAVIIAAKGGTVAGITIGDVLEILSAEDGLRGKEPSGPATFRALREAGIFGDGIPTLREIRDAGQRTVGELVDRYPVASRPVRDLIVDYLRERQPSIDYVSLKNRAYELARCFWADLEQHHPGIDSLRLSPEMAAAWKQRLRTANQDGRLRREENRRGGGAAQLPRRHVQRPVLLPGPVRMGAGRPRTLGAVGGAEPRQRRRPGPPQGRPAAEGQDGRPHPGPPARPAGPGLRS